MACIYIYIYGGFFWVFFSVQMVLTHLSSSMVLDKVVEYFHYWYRYRNSDDVPDMDIPVELCLELLAAADYLGLDQYVLRRLRVTLRT